VSDNAPDEGSASLGVRRVFAAGEVLASEGDVSDDVFLVVRGEVAITAGHGAQEVVLSTVGVGAVIGEVAALAKLPRSATMTASGECEVRRIGSAEFARWLSSQPDRAAEVAAQAGERLRRSQAAAMAVQLFGPGSGELASALLERVEWVELDAGECLFAEGDVPAAVYFVLSGRLRATRLDSAGATVVLGDVGRGELVGEMAPLQQSARTATVTALRDSTLGRVGIEVFESLLLRHPELALGVVRHLLRRLDPRARPPASARVLALVAMPDLSADVLSPMLAELHRHGAAVHIDRASIGAALDDELAADAVASSLGETRLAQFLLEVESQHDVVVYRADPTLTAWSRRIVQRADCVVVVASARHGVVEQQLIRDTLATCSDTRVPKWLAMVDRPDAARPTRGSSSPVRALFDEVHHVRRGHAADLERLARLSIGKGYGLVLGGGGARGFAHLGVIRAMQELGIPVDRVGGASMGSIFAAASAIYHDVPTLMDVCSKQFDRLLDYTVPIVSLLKAKRITANLESVFGGIDAEDTWTPFYCVSTNLTRSVLEVHRRGDLPTAIRASIAIPGVLPPVPYHGDLLVDGGVLNNVPADLMREDPSIGTVIAVDVAPSNGPVAGEDYGMYLSGWQAVRRFVRRQGSPYPGVGQVLVRTMITASERQRRAFQEDGTADLYLDLDIAGVGLLEFNRMNAVVEKGYVAARPLLQAWRATTDVVSAG
jgi:predicted acylesterase/phospholipase RssA/CRP-like cAMP-binding protein